MEEQQKQEGQKTVVAFVAGLLIGGLLVWVFSGTADAPAPETGDQEEVADEMTDSENGDGSDDSADNNSSDTNNTSDNTDTTTPAPTMEVGDGSVSVSNQPASQSVELESVTFPTDEGWVGVRSYSNDQLGSLLGVVRYSKEQGLVPDAIQLQVSTTPGRSYAIVFYTDNGDREFSLADDVQIDEVFATFTAQ